MHTPPSPRLSARGFTLVEVLTVVTIVGLVAAIAVPTLVQVRRSSTTSRLASDLRKHTQAYQHYHLQQGQWPIDGYPSTIPSGMQEYLAIKNWRSTTAIGGQWDFDANTYGVTAAISIYGHNADDAQLRNLDALLDDGDLNTGPLRKLYTNGISFVLEE